MDFEKLEVCPDKNPNQLVKVTSMGNVMEVQYMKYRSVKQSISMLEGGEQYVIHNTGEICNIKHCNSRADSKKSLCRTFANARALINANVTDVSHVRWVTLTYAENMTDTVRLYNDFKKFYMRFCTWCKKQALAVPEYIVMMEPQGRGAWHAHLLFIWDTTAPFIPNDELRRIWRQGFVKVKKLDNVDNVGAYLTAYLGDMDLSECETADISGFEQREVEVEDDDGNMVKKRYVKGARLKLYPVGFKMLRHSRGIKYPVIEYLSQEQAEKKVSAATKTFEKTIRLSDGDEYENVINICQYNLIRKDSQ